ncbi:hypothetical protein HDU67_001335, partial [Dinochytrium kinnereticum]
MFQVNAPRPFGGKKNVGFSDYTGRTTGDLLAWILKRATEPPNSGRGKKRAAPGEALKYTVDQLNEVLALQKKGSKDEMDEAVLKGMSRAGHLDKTTNRIYLPEYLRHETFCKDEHQDEGGRLQPPIFLPSEPNQSEVRPN